MLKVSSKPISSPSRTEKFPPPLMRFLRTNVGSKSRGRSRASPMFVRKKNVSIETQEPSSPKVTCIGQVRVRRSSKNSGQTPAKKRHCWWVQRTLFCTKKLKPRSISPLLGKWVSFFRFGYCKKVNIREDSSKKESNQIVKYGNTETEEEDEVLDEEEGARNREKTEGFVCSSPPKNAFLLTRCRSAPYRSSSLANRFWGLTETGEDEERETERPISETEPNRKDSIGELGIDQETGENLGISKQIEGSINGRSSEDIILELKAINGVSALPLILTRCKSEPARTGERLIPER